jgi:hypothetical protein
MNCPECGKVATVSTGVCCPCGWSQAGPSQEEELRRELAECESDRFKWREVAISGEKETRSLREELRSKDERLKEAEATLRKIGSAADKEWPGLANSVLRFKGVAVASLVDEYFAQQNPRAEGEKPCEVCRMLPKAHCEFDESSLDHTINCKLFHHEYKAKKEGGPARG